MAYFPCFVQVLTDGICGVSNQTKPNQTSGDSSCKAVSLGAAEKSEMTDGRGGQGQVRSEPGLEYGMRIGYFLRTYCIIFVVVIDNWECGHTVSFFLSPEP